MKFIKFLLGVLWHWSSDAGGRNAKPMLVGSVFVTNQSQLDQFISNVTASRDTHLTLAGDNSYVLDIVKLMKDSNQINNNNNNYSSQFIMESKGGPAEINCTASESDPEKLREVVKPISNASVVQLDGLIFTGCPVPIMIEEVNNVTIQNCVFQ